MARQADINTTILQQLQSIADKQDKCGSNEVSSGASSDKRVGAVGGGVSGRNNSQRTVILDHSSESDSDSNDSDNESEIRRNCEEANGLLQARFKKITGRKKSAKTVESDIRKNRPYAYLDRDTQRQLNRTDSHPEELSFVNHVEGLTAMIEHKAIDSQVRGMLIHVNQIIRDSNVHPWDRIRKWSNEIIFRTAIGEWKWSDYENIIQAKNAQYLIQVAGEMDEGQPCPEFNKGVCVYSGSHYLLVKQALIFVHSVIYSMDQGRPITQKGVERDVLLEITSVQGTKMSKIHVKINSNQKIKMGRVLLNVSQKN